MSSTTISTNYNREEFIENCGETFVTVNRINGTHESDFLEESSQFAFHTDKHVVTISKSFTFGREIHQCAAHTSVDVDGVMIMRVLVSGDDGHPYKASTAWKACDLHQLVFKLSPKLLHSSPDLINYVFRSMSRIRDKNLDLEF